MNDNGNLLLFSQKLKTKSKGANDDICSNTCLCGTKLRGFVQMGSYHARSRSGPPEFLFLLLFLRTALFIIKALTSKTFLSIQVVNLIKNSALTLVSSNSCALIWLLTRNFAFPHWSELAFKRKHVVKVTITIARKCKNS